MKERDKKLDNLLERLSKLSAKQEEITSEIDILKKEARLIGLSYKTGLQEEESSKASFKEIDQKVESNTAKSTETLDIDIHKKRVSKPQVEKLEQIKNSKDVKTDFEKFIGENLISKIGILITIIGVGIGTKYSIENNLINPATRIVLGFIAGFTLLYLSYKLKKKYLNFSAVLSSGASAVLYYISYAGYIYYDLYPKGLSFLLLLACTVLTVYNALNYNKQVIAHIGLVGAYTLPFLLSDGSGQVAYLFSYMAIINIGILMVAIYNYWRALYYHSFIVTLLIFSGWYAFEFSEMRDLGLALSFLFIFFAIFQATYLLFKVKNNQKFIAQDIVLIIANSMFLFLFGSFVIKQTDHDGYLSLFILSNALIHFITILILKKLKSLDEALNILLTGLSILCVTIIVPLELDGNWVSIVWLGEAILLFWIGRKKAIFFYEVFSYFAFSLALNSFFTESLGIFGGSDENLATNFINEKFAMYWLFALASILIIRLNNNVKVANQKYSHASLYINYISGFIIILFAYLSFYGEINLAFEHILLNNSYDQSAFTEGGRINVFQNLSILLYSALFLSLLIHINRVKVKNELLKIAGLVFGIFVLLITISEGLFLSADLRTDYLYRLGQGVDVNQAQLLTRYAVVAAIYFLLRSIYKLKQAEEVSNTLYDALYDLLKHGLVLSLISSEFLHWIDLYNLGINSSLMLSIIWGIYALYLVFIGFNKHKKHLRIAAISWFGVTLLKLFFHDIAHLDTLFKTAVFIGLGVLLLIISFVYNKFRLKLQEEEKKESY